MTTRQRERATERHAAIDRADPRPLHQQVYEDLLASIRDGKVPLRGKLPSERELVSLYDVSRITVRHAVRELIRQGIVRSQPGKGLYVAENGKGFELEVLRSFTSTALASGRVPGHRLLRLEVVKASLEISRPLFLAPASNVIVLSRLRLLDGVPVVLQTDWVPASRAPGLTDLDWSVANRSLYAELREIYGIQPRRGQTTLSARLASESEAEMLELPRPAAVLTVDQIAFDERDRPINMTALVHHPDRYPLTLLQSATGDFREY
ncbi:GntR family transcriptional regulator (plasmid) [Rhizobium sp. T1470]|uniref:GntR family transcriptional regulator n=1 Tax=unclassified Rhizobium TaxID=2613769 RepID=UPI001CD31F28|nr:GntR family transcriptional regulator [Rhizobium sp. T1473]MCA0805412.1 GntR family transcriptional regulator [Rhizobium sp. T1473]